ncbi:hypothetical protein [Rhodobacter ferrooxidans]|uniref:Uncharacterized protein n=1 Tax=Rhodobacter ferrooxidans TaxID=371731 RepID=C8S1N0_9RHOB|nr:hypothetical protein [Rhodobacter sp. SW2]EEW25203.1 hypothetical protein Rsw2DRAFT_1958 [Rhodobacter sp. SW2]
MSGDAIYFGLPICSYLALCALPKGRVAAIGVSLAAVVAAGFWLAGVGVEVVGDRLALIKVMFAAIALAALLQWLRTQLGAKPPRWIYPALVVLAMAEGGSPAVHMLGM